MAAIPNDGAGFGSVEDMKLSERDLADADFLCEFLRNFPGERHAFSVKALSMKMGISARKVRTLVTYLRRHGLPILATPDTGYFWPESRAEAEHTIAFLTARVASTLAVRNGIQRGLDEVFGAEVEQLELAG